MTYKRTRAGDSGGLTEGGDTLEILFQAIYPRPFPSLKDLKFDDIMLLAEAAEKYQDFSMIYTSIAHHREVLYPSCSSWCYDGSSLQSKRRRLLAHAVKHDDLEMVRELQPLLINIPLSEVADIFFHMSPSRVGAFKGRSF
ncbi:hypothetical protein LENED_004711 [Lentinula edodes]|uniref:BTB domain-containing protein n=1 Tax=Lentinula edodes TaxID=5353 RepID=A0A1Q3E7F3_LENED|nr:hypothetical protein LENED_004711 [Lentinula edodes]